MFQFTSHFWSGTKCYILGRLFKTPLQQILIFDLETQQIKSTGCYFHSNEYVVDMHVDEMEMTVSVCMKSQEKVEHPFVVRRFNLR
jgi:hypothetical protein